jgi:hypothetical protein
MFQRLLKMISRRHAMQPLTGRRPHYAAQHQPASLLGLSATSPIDPLHFVPTRPSDETLRDQARPRLSQA